MKNRGIQIAGLGIGAADPVALLSYASGPEVTLFVEDFSQLSARVIETGEILCPSKLC